MYKSKKCSWNVWYSEKLCVSKKLYKSRLYNDTKATTMKSTRTKKKT